MEKILEFKILANIENSIITYNLPVAVIRNGHIADCINDVYFNETNRETNQEIFFKYLASLSDEVSEQQNLMAYRKQYDNDEFGSLSLQAGYGLSDEQRHVISNILYNLSINVSNSLAYNIFLLVLTLPNLEYDEAAFILKFEDIPVFIESLKLLSDTDEYIFSKRYRSDLSDFINDFEKEKITSDVILSHNYFFSEDFDLEYGYGNPEDLLLSDNFRLYLNKNKGNFEGFNYNELVESYIEEEDINLLYTPIFNAYKTHIINNNVNRDFIDIKECKELTFIHNKVIESFEK